MKAGLILTWRCLAFLADPDQWVTSRMCRARGREDTGRDQ